MRRTVNNKRQAGFSTLEMLIVIAMSVVITAIAVPSYLNTSAYFLNKLNHHELGHQS